MTRISPFVVAVLAGCYASHRVPTPSPCDDPDFDPDVTLNLTFDAQGVLVGEGFLDDRFQAVPGWVTSISDDGQWLVTAYWRDAGADVRLAAVLTNLASGSAREWEIDSVLYHPVISGDGSTIFYLDSDSATTGTLTVVDRATLEERPVVFGRHGLFDSSPTISDDGRRAVVWMTEDERAGGVVVDLETGEEEPLAELRGVFTHGGVLSGDGRSVTYWSLADLYDTDPAEAVIVGPTGLQSLPGVWGGAISDDGCEFIAATHAVPYTGGTPILGLRLLVGGHRVALGPEGEANVWVSHVELSGDGGTAVIVVADADGLAMLARIQLADGRVETQGLGACSVNGLAVSDDGAVIAVDVFGCDGSREPNEHTRVFRPGTW